MTLRRGGPRFTIRARLVGGSVLVAAIIFALAIGVVRLQTAQVLEASNQTLASDDLISYATEILANPGDLVDDSGAGILIYIRNPAGRPELVTVPRPIEEAVSHRAGSNETFETSVGKMKFVVVGRVVHTPVGDWSLWAARSEASSELALHGLDRVFGVAGVLLLIVFAGASWILASAVLRPVARMRQQAEVLSLDGETTLPVSATRDELSELAVTLNSFLRRVRESALREKQMVSDAAHELRTPLAALTTQLELAHDHFNDVNSLSQQVIAAQKSVGRLSALTMNLLELSRLEAESSAPGKVTMSDRSTADALVTELMGSVDRARLVGQNPQVEIGFVLHGELADSPVPISALSFGRLLDNLILNSIAALQRQTGVREPAVREPAVLVTLAETSSHIEVTVQDNGPGMAAAFIPHAFERFTRPDNSRTAQTGGTGLGLALVHAIVIHAGGSIALTNTGHGLDVGLKIPKM